MIAAELVNTNAAECLRSTPRRFLVIIVFGIRGRSVAFFLHIFGLEPDLAKRLDIK